MSDRLPEKTNDNALDDLKREPDLRRPRGSSAIGEIGEAGVDTTGSGIGGGEEGGGIVPGGGNLGGRSLTGAE